MNNTIEKIQKITSKGQITIPISWRNKVKTDKILLKTKKDSIEISPFYLQKISKTKEYTVFDAIRDNKGKGLRADDMIKILKNIGS